MDPSGMKFAKTHEWVHVDGDVATIGISEFAVKQLTDLVYVELPDVGKTFARGAAFGVVESVKAASDLYAPIAGEVVEANGPLEDDLAVLSDDPYGGGWIVKLKMSDASQLDDLMDHAAYEEHCANEDH